MVKRQAQKGENSHWDCIVSRKHHCSYKSTRERHLTKRKTGHTQRISQCPIKMNKCSNRIRAEQLKSQYPATYPPKRLNVKMTDTKYQWGHGAQELTHFCGRVNWYSLRKSLPFSPERVDSLTQQLHSEEHAQLKCTHRKSGLIYRNLPTIIRNSRHLETTPNAREPQAG